MGKAIANGFPIAAVGGKRELMQHFNTRPGGNVYFAGTFNAHASCVAASLATMGILETGKVHEHIFRLGERMRAGLREIVARAGIPATVAGFGSVYVLYFMEERPITNYRDLLRNDAALFVRYRRELMKRGVFELPMNLKRNHISYSHTEADIDRTLEAAEESLQAALNGGTSGQ
jgi:glutamate-1-semialdehyde 2,1-aminomutase